MAYMDVQCILHGCSVNVYDIRKTCDDPPLCYDLSRVSYICVHSSCYIDIHFVYFCCLFDVLDWHISKPR